MEKKFYGRVLFSGGCGADPDGAVAALRESGFEVVDLLPEPDSETYAKGDTALQASKIGTDLNEIWDEADTTARRFGGECPECGYFSLTELGGSYVH